MEYDTKKGRNRNQCDQAKNQRVQKFVNGDDDISELFIVEPEFDFKINLIGTFKDGLKEDDHFNYSFSGDNVFHIKSVDNQELIPIKFKFKGDMYFVGKITSVSRIDDGICFSIIPALEGDILKFLRRIISIEEEKMEEEMEEEGEIELERIVCS